MSARLEPDLARQEAAALAACLAAPTQAITAQAVWGNLRAVPPPAPVMLEAASIVFALRHRVLGEIADSAEAFRQTDGAMIFPRMWAKRGSLRRAIALRRQANSLPPRVRDTPSPQGRLIREWRHERASPALDRWLRR